jgi:Flp pilus assembly protein TadG
MKLNRFSLANRLVKEECGQTLVFVSLILVAFLGLAGMSMDAGHGFYAYELLKSSTNAATLAGAAGLPNTTTATSYVSTYSSTALEKNAYGILQNVTTTPTFLCLNTVTTTLNVPCETSTGSSGGYNAIQVTQTAKIKTWIGQFFGVPNFNLTATATAAMSGGTTTPWNIAIILDTTASMGDADSGKQCSGSQISCALLGVQALLGDLYPCQVGATCTSATNYVDDVSLYVFPDVTNATAPYDYCSGSSGNPTHGYYTVPSLPSGDTYQIINYSHDYQTTDGAGLNTASNIVTAAGAGSGCSGIKAPGGVGTYYAQVIYAAQADLVTQQAANPGSKNAMIILSDGDATATVTYAKDKNGNITGISSTSDLQPSGGTITNLNGTSLNNPTSYTYPSAVGECGQAVVAAQAATQAGTTVYTIGYGSVTSGGCTSDKTYSASTGTTYGGVAWGPGKQPCTALAAMASTPSDFYSDDGDGCSANVPSNANLTTLTAIFHRITAGFGGARLIPNGTT